MSTGGFGIEFGSCYGHFLRLLGKSILSQSQFPLAETGDSMINSQDLILVRSLGWEDTLEKRRATHSSILAWRILWTKKPSGLQSIGSRRARYN